MLTHLNAQPISPKRVVIMGAGGFVGAAAHGRLKAAGVDCVALTRREVDLLKPGAGNVLAGDTKRYQCWYRTTVNPPCGLGVNDFNASNGLEVVWIP